MAKKKDELIPYDQVSPGYEAVYTGETSSKTVRESEMVSTLYSDEDGNLISQWSMIPWTFPDEEGRWNEDAWDDTVVHLNVMQAELGPLSDGIRLLRCHISGLVPCDSGLPATIDELLFAIARGGLESSSFKNGCLCSGLGIQPKTSQPGQLESLRTIHAVINAYLSGEPSKGVLKAYPKAAGFVVRTYEWLGAVADLNTLQRKMLDRVLLNLSVFTEFGYTGTDPQSLLEASTNQDLEAMGQDVFYGKNGRGPRLDAEISELAELPTLRPWDPTAYREALDELVEDEGKQELYKTCCHIASGIHTASDCHHNTFRYIESWIHGIGTGRLEIPTRNTHSEKKRLGQLLFGYALGLDKWLLRVPLQFLLLDLGHIDLGFDPRNSIVRVYACLGEEHTPVKEWLAACLWYTLIYNQQGGLIGSWTSSHTNLIQRGEELGVTAHEWIDFVLQKEG